ncbi:MAG: hypothetical protein K5639_08425 [Eubacterium sp.]|nr:hypothetical protein [Eubacterium sp.]
MISEARIRKMIRLSDYEGGLGEQDIRRTRYKKADYIRLQVIKTICSVIVSYALIIALVSLYYIDRIRFGDLIKEGFFVPERIFVVVAGVLVLLISLVVWGGFCKKRSAKEYDESELRVREYEKTLEELLALYEAERKEESV